jgi:hypothetical protein
MFGCGRRPSSTAAAPAAEPQAEPPVVQGSEPAHEIEKSTIRLADPQGRWTFEVESERAEAAGIHGPYVLTPAKGRYDEKGREPVLMSADRARVDEGARRVLLEGRVRVVSGGWGMETDRLDYDLGTGKVVASGRTKWTLTESPLQTRTSEEGRGHEKAAGP